MLPLFYWDDVSTKKLLVLTIITFALFGVGMAYYITDFKEHLTERVKIVCPHYEVNYSSLMANVTNWSAK